MDLVGKRVFTVYSNSLNRPLPYMEKPLKLTTSTNNHPYNTTMTIFQLSKLITLDAVTESVEHWSHVWDNVGSNPGRVKPMT